MQVVNPAGAALPGETPDPRLPVAGNSQFVGEPHAPCPSIKASAVVAQLADRAEMVGVEHHHSVRPVGQWPEHDISNWDILTAKADEQ